MADIIWPFLKWAGGKRRLVRHLAALCPDKIERYFEPFLGSGALFLYLAQTRPAFQAVLSDSNSELVNVYRCVKDCVKELIDVLVEHESQYYKDPRRHYYRIRDEYRTQSKVEKAARLIFLNKTCYNGLYRVNGSGRFNVPHGTYFRPIICNRNALVATSEMLNRGNVSIRCLDYRSAIARCKENDLVYFDPPYLPISKTASFTDYTSESFDYANHVTLANEFRRLTKLGCRVILSNSNSVRIRKMYEGFDVKTVGITRSINCDASKRTGHTELIVTNTPLIRIQTPRARQPLPA